MQISTNVTPSSPTRIYERFDVTGKLIIPFGFDGYIQPADERVGNDQGYASLQDAIDGAKDFATKNKGTAIVYELPKDWKTPAANGNFVLHEALAGPGGFTDATPATYILGNPLEKRGTKPTKFQFTDPVAKALVSAERVIFNETGKSRVRL